MPRLFISRLLETFFRRKWLFVLVLVPFIALGVVTVLGKGDTYRSSGVILVSKNLVDPNLREAGDPFSGEVPAIYASRQINTALLTDEFIALVLRDAGLYENLESGALTMEGVRGSISAAPTGDELVSIGAMADDPEVAFLLADATINSYPEWLKTNLRAQGVDPASLDVDLGRIDARYRNLVDDPIDGAPQPRRKQDATTLVLFTGLGLLVAGAALVVATLMDRSVRYDEEIEAHLHVPVLGTVPDSRAAIKPLVL